MKTGIYIRVSTEEQAMHGFSVRAQKEKLVYYATKIKNWKIYNIYIDNGISGKNINERPNLLLMLRDIEENKISNVLVFKIDRLTRSTRDLIDLIDFFNKNNCEFNSLNESIDTTTATGRMFIKIIGIFAEFERENIVERVRLGIDRKVKEGYTLSSAIAPYGYNRPIGEKTLRINEEESKVVKRIYNMFLKGFSIQEIIEHLKSKDIKTKKNKTWTHKTVRLILSNTTYIGKVRHNIGKDNYYENNGFHKPIITKRNYYKVQELFKSKNQKPYDAYFSHVLKCICKSDMVPKRVYKTDKHGNKRVYINYRCKNKTTGCSKDKSHNKVEKVVGENILNWTSLNIYEKNELLKSNKYIIYIDNNDNIQVLKF